MAAPTQFPVWLSKPGQPDMIATDLPGYNAAIGMGYTQPTNTPSLSIGGGVTVAQPSFVPQQPLDVQVTGQPDVINTVS